MDILREHYRHISLFYFRKDKNVLQAWKKLRDVYGEDCLLECQRQRFLLGFALNILTCKMHYILAVPSLVLTIK